MYLTSYLPALGYTGWLVVLLVFLLTKWLFTRRSNRNPPPGPISLPIVGSLLSLSNKDMRKSLRLLAAKYGDVMQLDLGLNRAVVLNSYNAMKESFVKHGQIYSFRPQSLFTECRKELGVVVLNEHWSEQKRFILQTLKNFGIGKNEMERVIQEEVSVLVKYLSNINRTSNIHGIFYQTSSIIIMRLVFGRSLTYDDPFLVKHTRTVEDLSTLLEKRVVTDFFPFLRYLPGDIGCHKEIGKLYCELRDIALDWIAQRKKTIDYSTEPRDFIDAYLRELKSKRTIPGAGFSEEMLAWHVTDLHAAGTETTGVTLTYAIYNMILHPDVQAKVQMEINEILGSRLPSLHDRIQMPFTEAVLSEVQRHGDVAPFAVPHTNNKDCEIKGYTIPKWTYILLNLHNVHRDPRHWPQPEKFDPTRFLDSSGRFKHREELLPFGIGKRNCLGEMLARSELFLVFVGVMQHFSFRIPEGGIPPDPVGNMGLVAHPKPAEIIIESRSHS